MPESRNGKDWENSQIDSSEITMTLKITMGFGNPNVNVRSFS